MSGRRRLMMANATDIWKIPLTFKARAAGASFYVHYNSQNTVLPTDDLFYRIGTSGQWLPLAPEQQLVADAPGWTAQLYCSSNYFSSGTSPAYMRKVQRASGTFDVTGDVTSLCNFNEKPRNAALITAFVDQSSFSMNVTLGITELASRCCQSLFEENTGLKSIRVRFTDWKNNISGTANWMKNVASSGTFYKPKELSTTFGISNIAEGWTVVEY